MFFKTIIAATALPLLALGRITSFTAPSTAERGSNITATIVNRGYISNWDDFGIIWTLKGESFENCTTCLGTQIGWQNLYNTPLADLGNQTVEVHLPEYFDAGSYTLTASIPYLVGASGTVGFTRLNQTIDIVDN